MIIRKAPQTLVNSALNWFPNLPLLSGAFVAGGFIRAHYAGERPNDMDLYFRSQRDFEAALSRIKDFSEWEGVVETDRAITLRNNGKIIQLIRFTYGEPEELISEFDFTICAAALEIMDDIETPPEGVEYLHERFFEDLAGRVLTYTGSRMPLASLKRVIKYVKRGYHICDENIIKIAESIAQAVNFDDQESVATHIDGMDPEGGRRVRVID